jgi:hypothetical protein
VTPIQYQTFPAVPICLTLTYCCWKEYHVIIQNHAPCLISQAVNVLRAAALLAVFLYPRSQKCSGEGSCFAVHAISRSVCDVLLMVAMSCKVAISSHSHAMFRCMCLNVCGLSSTLRCYTLHLLPLLQCCTYTTHPSAVAVLLNAFAGPKQKKRRRVQDGDAVKMQAPSWMQHVYQPKSCPMDETPSIVDSILPFEQRTSSTVSAQTTVHMSSFFSHMALC